MADVVTKELAPGMWLGTGNQIKSMGEDADGWWALDTTDVVYRQQGLPDGLQASDKPEDCRRLPRRPWPA